MWKKLPSLVEKRAAFIENWGFSVLICGYIQFITAFVDQYVVVFNLLLILMTHMWFYIPCINISC
ncbi:hypothetical protein BY996DRAFT_8204651 [Phakopsora pachyrhizi]|nr:hypothetical protein BY996DRAFT_8204651 [Phakopsora pachyrhizi]